MLSRIPPRTVVCTVFDPFASSPRDAMPERRTVRLPPPPSPSLAPADAPSESSPRTFLAYFPGFMSLRNSVKPEFLLSKCRELTAMGRPLGFFAPDWSGTGDSACAATASHHDHPPLDFKDCGIDTWLSDAVSTLLSALRPSPSSPADVFLAGASMGAWLAPLTAAELRSTPGLNIRGLMLLCPGFDFASLLFRGDPAVGAARRAELDEKGKFVVPSEYQPGGYVISRRLVESAEELALLDGSDYAAGVREAVRGIPVSVLYAKDDQNVPPEHMARAAAWFDAGDVREVVALEEGGHRLSGEGELQVIWECFGRLASL
ncbi:Alpha/Beta hydrolase protein [Hyaloraphidium curvatum]|nr:Alpha/Beta hydrolase protein [Hyaloraphidium curvatum]